MGEFFNAVMSALFGGQQASQPGDSADGACSLVRRQAGLSIQSLRQDRIRSEVAMIAPRFSNGGGVYYDEENCDWIMVPRYPLPERWQERWTKLLIVPPPTYPDTPPIGFYLNRKFHLKNGQADAHATGRAYHGAPDLLQSGWHWYCVTINNGPGGWQPKADYRQPDNLWTFLNMVRESLTNDF